MHRMILRPRKGAVVDHIDGNSPNPNNLQGLCHPCHQSKTEQSYQPMDDLGRAIRDAFLASVRESEPVMLAHDECWQKEWRHLHKQNLDWSLEQCCVPIELTFVDGQFVPRLS